MIAVGFFVAFLVLAICHCSFVCILLANDMMYCYIKSANYSSSQDIYHFLKYQKIFCYVNF